MSTEKNLCYRPSNKILYFNSESQNGISNIITGLSFIPPIPINPTKRESAVDRDRINRIYQEKNRNGSCDTMLDNIIIKRRAIGLLLKEFSHPNFTHSKFLVSPSLLSTLPYLQSKTIGKFSLFLHIPKDKLPNGYTWKYDKKFAPFGFTRKENDIWNVVTSPQPLTHDSLTNQCIRSLVYLDFFSSFEESRIPTHIIEHTLSQWIKAQSPEEIYKHIKIIRPYEKVKNEKDKTRVFRHS